MRILLTGASGQLGAYLVERLAADGHALTLWSGREMGARGGLPLEPVDLTSLEGLDRPLLEANPDWVIHAAAVSSAEGVRRDPDRANVLNVEATGRIAQWCGRNGRRFLFTSTDMVFGGDRAWSTEDDPALPCLAYGRSKLDAENRVRGVPGCLVARLPMMFGRSRNGRPGFFDASLEALSRGESRSFFEDEWRTPLHYEVAADLLARLIGAGAEGLIHVAGDERISRVDLMSRAAEARGIDPGLVRSNRRDDSPGAEPRPRDLSMATNRLAATLPGLMRPTLVESLRSEGGLS